jgi:hypothetical protein
MLTKTEKLSENLHVIKIRLTGLQSKEGHGQTNVLLFQCSTVRTFDCDTTTWISHRSTAVQHSVFLCSWQRRVTQQHPQNVLLCFHRNNSYANAPQCYVIRTLPVFLSVIHFSVVWQITDDDDDDTSLANRHGLTIAEKHFPPSTAVSPCHCSSTNGPHS